MLDYSEIKDWYERYGPMVYRRCRQMLKDEQAASDAMQDVFVKVLAAKSKIENNAPSSLLYQTATNTCLNIIRSKGRRPEDSDNDLIERIAVSTSSENQHTAKDLLARLFQSEPQSSGVIAMLHLHDGLTLSEVAKEVGMSVSGVRKRLRKLKASIKELEAIK